MNLERLRAVQAEEREADSLRPLPDSFYREVAGYIEELRDRRASAAAEADDPFGSEEVRRLTDEIETAEEVAEAVYERRVGKLVKRASLAAAGMPTDEEGLTSEEAELFADLVAQIEAHRSDVLATFDGELDEAGSDAMSGGLGDEPAAGDRDGAPEPTLDAGDAMGGGGGSAVGEDVTDPETAPPPPPDEPTSHGPEGTADGPETERSDVSPDGSGGEESADADERTGETERVTLRITRDVGEVFGVDERVYDLAAEDVVTLPAANAKPLLDRDAAEEID